MVDATLPKTCDQIRVWLESKLKRSVTDATWELLQDLDAGGFVQSVLDVQDREERAEALTYLLRAARRFERHARALQGKKTPPGRQTYEETSKRPLSFDENTSLRIVGLSDYLARAAALRPEVREFRQRFLGGRLLSPTEARAMLEARAAQYVPLESFKSLGIPLLEHTSTIDSRHEAGRWEITVSLVGGNTEGTYERTISRDRRELLAFPSEETRQTVRVPVWRKSVLDDVRALAEKLAERYHWQPSQSVWWLLTGAVPLIDPMSVTLSSYGRTDHAGTIIKLEIASWLPARVVTQVFRHAQREALDQRDNRSLDAKTLTLFRFVNDHVDEEAKATPWTELMALWNQQQRREWAYTDRGHFRRDFLRGNLLICFSTT